jgi:alpha-glucosidase
MWHHSNEAQMGKTALMPQLLLLLATSVVSTACGWNQIAAQEHRKVSVGSPSGKIRADLIVDADRGKLLYSIERNGKRLIEPSSLDVRLVDLGPIAAGASIQNVARRDIDQSSTLLWGKSSHLRDHCRAATIRLKSKSGIAWDIELRAYEDGIALRYGFPEQDGLREFVIEGESTEFRLAGDPSILFMTLDHFKTSHEAPYERKNLSQLPENKLIAVPMLALWNDGSAVAITEARLRDFAGMYLEKKPSPFGRGKGEGNAVQSSPPPQPSPQGGGSVLQTRLAPLPERDNAVVAARAPHWSPWRVVLVGDHAGKLLESNLLLCLNDPPEGDYSWLHPGKTTWPWWNGTVEHGPPSTPELNFAINKYYMDFCAKHGIAYHAISSVAEDRPWYVQRDPGFAWPHADTNILEARPDIDLPKILEYAATKGVGIRLWVNWKPLADNLDEAFATYESWGVKGLMIDFMDRDDQEMVRWQEQVLRAAARHKLHVQFHGSYKPSGEQRTFPNLFNREGVLNLEYLKWSDTCSPAHSVNVAYTRGLAGQVDYHLGGFRHASRSAFQPRDDRPSVLGTRAHHLALYVVFENPMPMLADIPSAYENQPGFDFLVDVPTTWDETRFVAGDTGEYVVVARRSGKNWYLGGITNWTPRKVTLPLDFLGTGKFEATLYQDVSEDGEKPNEVRIETRPVNATTMLEVTFASGGGFAAVFTSE